MMSHSPGAGVEVINQVKCTQIWLIDLRLSILDPVISLVMLNRRFGILKLKVAVNRKSQNTRVNPKSHQAN